MFDINKNGLVPCLRDYSSGIPRTELVPRDGDNVTLKIENKDVIIENIRAIGNNEYEGMITHKIPHGYYKKAMNLGPKQKVTFREENIFTVEQKTT